MCYLNLILKRTRTSFEIIRFSLSFLHPFSNFTKSQRSLDSYSLWSFAVPNIHETYDFGKMRTFIKVIMRIIKRSHTADNDEIINKDEIYCNYYDRT